MQSGPTVDQRQHRGPTRSSSSATSRRTRPAKLAPPTLFARLQIGASELGDEAARMLIGDPARRRHHPKARARRQGRLCQHRPSIDSADRIAQEVLNQPVKHAIVRTVPVRQQLRPQTGRLQIQVHQQHDLALFDQMASPEEQRGTPPYSAL